jgi:hypothetical protein
LPQLSGHFTEAHTRCRVVGLDRNSTNCHGPQSQYGATLTDIDKLTGYLKQGGAKALTAGGAPVGVAGPAGMSRSIVFDDGNGFFVELVQPDKLLEQLGGPTSNAPRSFVYGLDTTVTVADLDKSAQFFREVLGLNVTADPSFHADPKRLQVLGLKGAQYREATVAWPDRTPQLNLVQFNGIKQKTLTGSTRLP